MRVNTELRIHLAMTFAASAEFNMLTCGQSTNVGPRKTTMQLVLPPLATLARSRRTHKRSSWPSYAETGEL
jgi:hypothetical protein